ncbi:PREDICTED: E3 ubiquitin-protein ligase FANCL [Ceratosolen solmsi marchali]|uniref:E3 ubiquitin-protein ligase FANCL n=1 Tax=Ceratosolen solmsi marchali TaxID=326594 RepID=A0AAJ6VNU9_9HYME|nr:PREDICTED: E3 ubiquitin-protein ligase FANCL [Ceratosolen solmsi marchali]XP_011495739.1 PREDICTED: E3 ubiquitin-protein ligase FANCL [Ceratosolen solmsi marchali]
MDDLEEMLKLYPEMILISRSPPTWKGLLSIKNGCINCEMKVKVKLAAPSFPRLDNASIHFGGSIAYLFGARFKNLIDSIMKTSESVPCFFQELTEIIENLVNENQDRENSIGSMDTTAREKLLKELDNVLSEYSCVDFSSTKNLNAIKLTMNDVSIIVKPVVNSVGKQSWKICSSDLPELPDFIINEKKSWSLREIGNMFQKQVDILEDTWGQLRRIDNYCYVTDPVEPKPYHLYRRIYLSPSLSCLITINPLDPTGYPMIKLLGVQNEVDKFRNLIQDEGTIDSWDIECSVYENLLTLLKIDEFPGRPKSHESIEEGVVGDEECCICFSMELEDNSLPDEICNNEKCRRHFHSICLFQWLQELVTNKIVFNKIFGSCPNCGEEASCNIPST